MNPTDIAAIINEESPDPIDPGEALNRIGKLLTTVHLAGDRTLGASSIMHNDEIARNVAYLIQVSKLDPNDIIPKLEQHEDTEYQRLAQIISEILREQSEQIVRPL